MQGIAQVRPVDPVLTNFGLEFLQESNVWAADAACPWVRTAGDTGTYYIPDALNALRNEDAIWAWNAPAPAVDVRFTSAAFRAQKYGFRTAVGDDDRRNWTGGGASLDQRAAIYVAEKLALNREIRVEALVDASSMTATTLTTTNRWNQTTANPRADVNAAMGRVRKFTGKAANTIIIPGDVWVSITGTQTAGSAGAAILDGVKYTMTVKGSDLTPALIAGYFGLDVCQPALAVQSSTAVRETTTVSTGLPQAGAYVWDKDEVYILYVDRNPGPRSLTWGVSFGPTLFEADSYRSEEIKADWIRGTQILDEVEVCQAAGQLLDDVLA